MMKCTIGSFVLFSSLFGASTGAECYKRDLFDIIHYYGEKSVTESGFSCLRWDDISSSGNSMDENYCRYRYSHSEIGCFIMNSNIVWEACDIPECDAECFIRDKFLHAIYDGHTNRTASGIPCQRWDSNSIPEHFRYWYSNDSNYCRPYFDKIICYPMNQTVGRQPCDIPECGVNNQSTITTPTPAIPESPTAHVSSVPLSDVNTEHTSPKPLVETTTDSIPTSTTAPVSPPSTAEVNTEQTSPKSLVETTTTPVECTTPVQTTMTNVSVCLLSTSDLQDRQLYWYNFFHSNLSKAERDSILEKEKEAIRKELLLDTKLLTSYLRKKRCAEDNRYSAQAIGRVGIGFMVTIAVLIVLSDLISCFKFIK